ncbi:MAG: Dyp-type peroxidase, partial [Pseudomonadales bacterium]|nr:Dyp-type peroxidase [Pseudomonadales bacterium]
ALADKPGRLQKFQAIHNHSINMPATDADMLLHIRSARHDINYHFALQLFAQLKPFLSLDEMVHGFRYLDSRDFTGFVDGTENPQGDARAQVALVADDECHNGGSYIHLQKYHHDLSAWQQLSLAHQESSYGRSKVDNIEFSSADKLASAHTKRAAIKGATGHSLEILRHSLPFGDLRHSGLLFASYCANPDNFNLMLQSMCSVDEAGECDKILAVSSAVTGHAFFAPNLSWFKSLSGQ